jgi:hypothetical protein
MTDITTKQILWLLNKVLVMKPEGKRLLGRPRRRWDDINTDLREVGCRGMDWIEIGTGVGHL